MSASPGWSDWLAVCGLKREAKTWGGRAVCGGGRSDLLEKRIQAAIAERRPAGVISFGICGALSPQLDVGQLVVARQVKTPGSESWTCDAAAYAALGSTGARPVDMLSSDEGVTEPRQKASLAAQGDVADMESHVAARLAHAHGLPLVVLRAVSDGAGDRLPPAAMAAMQPDGGVSLAAVLASLVREPGQLPNLVRMARNAGGAFKALEAARRRMV